VRIVDIGNAIFVQTAENILLYFDVGQKQSVGKLFTKNITNWG
jgi:hypothetical protein